jgi:hypothetical protein
LQHRRVIVVFWLRMLRKIHNEKNITVLEAKKY